MSRNASAFEEPILELKAKIEGLKAQPQNPKVKKDIARFEQKLIKLQRDVFSRLSDWQRCVLARHPDRPHTRDYIEHLCDDFEELHGDRRYADDPAIMAGFGTRSDRVVCFVGHQKGRDIKAKLHRNFGMSRPEGFRKARRAVEMAGRFKLPLITLVDTPGPMLDLEAEHKGLASAISELISTMSLVPVATVSTLIGEGGSEAAMAFSVADRVLMMQNAIYTPISPETGAETEPQSTGSLRHNAA